MDEFTQFLKSEMNGFYAAHFEEMILEMLDPIKDNMSLQELQVVRDAVAVPEFQKGLYQLISPYFF